MSACGGYSLLNCHIIFNCQPHIKINISQQEQSNGLFKHFHGVRYVLFAKNYQNVSWKVQISFYYTQHFMTRLTAAVLLCHKW